MNDASAVAVAFPGMGVRLAGTERKFFLKYRDKMLPFFEEASDAAHIDLAAFLENSHRSTENLNDLGSQLFTLAFSAALYDLLEREAEVPRYLAPYSFGVYAALFAAHALTFSQTLSCACRAYDIMCSACGKNDWNMAVIIGLTIAEIKEIAGSIVLVNITSDTCAIIAGRRADSIKFCEDALQRGALKAEVLPVSIPYHLPGVLAASIEEFRSFLKTISWNKPAFPIISTIDQRELDTCESLLDFTARHIGTPINWLKTVSRLRTLGITRIIECGPGISLSRHGMFMPFEITYVNIKTLSSRLGA